MNEIDVKYIDCGFGKLCSVFVILSFVILLIMNFFLVLFDNYENLYINIKCVEKVYDYKRSDEEEC